MNKLGILIGSLILYLVVPFVAHAGSTERLLLSPSKTVVNTGDTVTVTVVVSTPDQAMNAVSGSIVFPSTMALTTIGKDKSIVSFWTQEPHPLGNRIDFEGIVLNPGYQGTKGVLFTATFTAKRAGALPIFFKDGAILANDGLGTNVLDTLGTTTIAVKDWQGAPLATVDQPVIASATPQRAVILPVITDYSELVSTKTVAFLKGKGEPGALTKIVFKNTALKSIGERFTDFVQTKKNKLDEVLVKNDAGGLFEYVSKDNLIAGAYNATPFLVDTATNTERPGLGVQLLVNDSQIVHILVVFVNILALLVPIVGLIVLIYFIPWYSLRRMHLLKRRLGLEEEKIEVSEHKLKNQDKILDTVLQSSNRVNSDTK
jgi:hypothetical protein